MGLVGENGAGKSTTIALINDMLKADSGEVKVLGVDNTTAEFRNVREEVDTVLPRKLTVDCGRVTFMDSSGIAVLLRLWQRMEALGGTLRVTGLREQPARVLRAAGLERLITIEFE